MTSGVTGEDGWTEQGRAMGGVIDVLEAVGAIYAIWGGLAVVAHGEPRFTMDLDVLLSPENFYHEPFVRRLHETHYHVDALAVKGALLEGGFFNVIHLNTHIKTDFYVPWGNQTGHEAFLQRLLAERVRLPFDEIREAAYLSAGGAIASKLLAFADSGSTRHLDDIASIVRVQGRGLDEARIDVLAARFGVLGAWRAVWQANDPRPR